ncbi:MAG: hypothetical protein ABFC34_01490 [Methanobacterium sp.]
MVIGGAAQVVINNNLRTSLFMDGATQHGSQASNPDSICIFLLFVLFIFVIYSLRDKRD